MMRLSPAPTRHEDRAGPVLEGEILGKEDKPGPQQELNQSFPEIGAVIQKALRAAGDANIDPELMKMIKA